MASENRSALGITTAAALTIGAGLLYALPLWHLDLAPGPDWRYFDALSRVVRSSLYAYGRFPLHDPWVCGGTDLLANPQSRIFSPLGLLDLVFTPHTANVLSLVVYAIGGAFAGYALLRSLARDRLSSVAGALAFLAGSWFMLHYSEGHIPYGAFQLLPAVALCFLRLDEPRARLGLAALLALFLLDGGMYAFIFSIYLFVAMVIVGLVPLGRALKSLGEQPLTSVGLAAAFALVTAPKVVPVLSSLGVKALYTERTTLGREVLTALFDPHQSRLRALPTLAPSSTAMHEYGCYVGFAALAVVLVASLRAHYRRPHLPWLALIIAFVWIGTNWGDPVNPWALMQKIPLLNNAHIQSRLFVLAYLAWIVMVSGALTVLRRARPYAAALVVLELALVSFFGWRAVYAPAAHPRPASETASLVTTREWRGTVPVGPKPHHYGQGLGSFDCYEPAMPRRGIRHNRDRAYRGEIVAEGAGAAKLAYVEPGEIAFDYRGEAPARVAVNLNSLAGWRVVRGAAVVDPAPALLVLRVDEPGTIVVRYLPWYWPWICAAFALGLGLSALLARRIMRRPS